MEEVRLLHSLISKLQTEGISATFTAALKHAHYLIRLRFAQIKFRGDSQRVFRWIYEKNIWASPESKSGSGSTKAYTQGIRSELRRLILKFEVESIIDAGCGDFNWMGDALSGLRVDYLGIDIVDEVVLKLQQEHSTRARRFKVGDVRNEVFPPADLLICRDVLFHFSAADIMQTLNNFIRSDVKYLLITSHVTGSEYRFKNILSGDYRLVDLEKAPFFMESSIECLEDWVEGHAQRRMLLFERSNLALPRP